MGQLDLTMVVEEVRVRPTAEIDMISLAARKVLAK